MFDKLNKYVDKAKETAEDSALRIHGKAKGLFEKPITRTKETLFKKLTYFYCSTCGAEIGPAEENKVKSALDKLVNETKAVFNVISVNPVKQAKGGVGRTKIALGDKSDTSFTSMFENDVIRDHKSKALLIQCDYCGKYHCSSCWNLDKNRCKNCENLELKDLFS